MAAMSRGQAAVAGKIRKTKGGTESSRKHHFQSFSQRVAKLNIDPIRRIRRHDDTDLSATSSYFRSSLDEWKELNLSENFTRFVDEVEPLCESLPQIVHHNDRIMDLLVSYIEREDALSSEPLLSLLSHFAHDLGVRFEKHFGRAVQTVTRIAAKHKDVEVIEWSFTCLAWLFKYLSRLLVPDLRPLFDLMAPYLGKEHQKPFITRFAAEALSFLFRKVGAASHRDKVPLSTIIAHILEDLKKTAAEKDTAHYEYGLMTLFIESIKGIQRQIHSSGLPIMKELLTQTKSLIGSETPKADPYPAETVVDGVLIAAIHHTESETFKPLLEAVVETADSVGSGSDGNSLCFVSRLLFVVSGVRKGSRIGDWAPLLKSISNLVAIASASDVANAVAVRNEALISLAVILQSCPMDAAIPYLRQLELLSKGSWRQHFLPFCMYFAELGSERFQSLLLPHMQKFISSNWEQYGESFSYVLPTLIQTGALTAKTLTCPPSWQTSVLHAFQALTDDDEESSIWSANGYLSMFESLQVERETETRAAKDISTFIRRVAYPIKSRYVSTPRDQFAFGKGLKYAVEIKDVQVIGLDIWQLLSVASQSFRRTPIFWKAVSAYVAENKEKLDFGDTATDRIVDSLIACMASPSHELRLLALEIFSQLYTSLHNSEPEILATAILIETTPLDLQTARAVSMHLRKIANSFKSVSSDKWLSRAMSAFCFGMLHVKFSQIWTDACNALKLICESKEGEDAVSHIAFSWLHGALDAEEYSPLPDPRLSGDQFQSRPLTEFECSNLLKLSHHATQAVSVANDATEQARQLFEYEHQSVPFIIPSSRTQALLVLNAIPQVAEKKSRELVPVLLEWVHSSGASSAEEEPADDDMQEDEGPSKALAQKWSRRDQKAMLQVFGKFVNPKVLYKSEDVYASLLSLLSNGDVEIQKSALKAVLTWKQKSIVRYEENLLNLLDDARFREQIAVFLNLDENDDGDIQREDRAALMPIILRLLYGKVVTRAGSASGKRGQESRRRAVFIALTKFGEEVIVQFLKIALGPLAGLSVLKDGRLNEEELGKDLMDARKQNGLLNMLDDLIDTLRTQFAPLVGHVVDPILYCVIQSSRAVSAASVGESSESSAQQLSLRRSIRQLGIHSLELLFRNCPDYTWDAYAAPIVEELVQPRLEKLPIETAQSVSGVLRLLASWCSSLQTAHILTKHDQSILPKVAECLEVPSAKDEVKLFILNNVLGSLLGLLRPTEEITETERSMQQQVRSNILQPNANVFLVQIGSQLRKSPSKDVLEAGVKRVAELAPIVEGSTECRNLVEISVFLLQQPTKRVNPRTKGDLLRILQEFVPRVDFTDDQELYDTLLDVTGALFAFFLDRESRVRLGELLSVLATNDRELQEVARLCIDLNSFAVGRLDEPDFERRSKAFGTVTEEKWSTYSLKQWKPLVHNMLFYIRDEQELSIRVNSSYALRRFVEAAGHHKDADGFKAFVTSVLIPAIQRGLRESVELVRVEYLSVLAQLVRQFPDWSTVNDMHVLLFEDDDETSFFSNILHIQQHRRMRALRRLVAEVKSGKISSWNIAHFFIPLIEHFIFDKADDDAAANNLAGESINAIGALAEWLEWPQYRALLRRFTGYLQSKQDLTKTIVRLISHCIDSLNRAGQTKGYVVHNVETADGRTQDAEEKGDDEEMADADEQVENGKEERLLPDTAMDIDTPKSTLSTTLPSQSKLADDLTNNLLPTLTKFLHDKDETTVSLRIPVAYAVVKVLCLLPVSDFSMRLPSILLDVCNILRSKAPEAREMTRRTLADIATLIGPSYFGYIVKELRTALQRGYQLHVLSYTVHSILVHMSPTLKPGDLDYCVGDVVSVIMDDIFGVTGQEKDAEEYISKMKEVKSSKSFDTMELMAKATTLHHLVHLIRPIQSLLLERLDLRTTKKIDELLRRIGLGVLGNTSVKDRDILVFSYEVIQEVYKAQQAPKDKKEDDERTRRYLINMKGAKKSGRGTTTSQLHKMIRFILDVLRTVLHKHTELQTPANLKGFMPIIGDALVSSHEEVQMSALRLLSTIIKVPLPEIDKNGPTYVAEAIRIIKGQPSTNTELAQAALKLVSAVLRERRSVVVRDIDVAFLLKRLRPDLEEPDRQGVTFNFLKAVMARKMVIPEVYEIADTVAAIMVTNQTKTARDLARGVYFQFIMEYPQGKDRLSKQLAFLVKNLTYKYVEGRQSVMEALHLLVTKIGDSLIQDVLATVFAPLVLVMVNDDNSDCREMAGALVKAVFERADDERVKTFTTLLRTWIEQDQQTLLKRVAVQCWTLYMEVEEGQTKDAPYFLARLTDILEESMEDKDDADWELLFYCLQALAKLCKMRPDLTFAADAEPMWTAVCQCLTFPHAWVKLSSAQLIGLYFANFGTANAENGLASLPLVGSGGLELTEDRMRQLTAASLRVLNVQGVSEKLCTQSVRNLVFLGRCFAANGILWKHTSATDTTAEEEGEAAASGSENEDEAIAEEEEVAFTPAKPTALHHIFYRLIRIMQRAPKNTAATRAPTLYPKTASLQLIAALTNILPPDALTPNLPTILRPLLILTDPLTTVPYSTDPAFEEGYKALISGANEILNTLQKRLGTKVYVDHVQRVKDALREKREGRRAKRRVEAMTEPEKWGMEKKRRREVGRERRKERGAAERGKRRGW